MTSSSAQTSFARHDLVDIDPQVRSGLHASVFSPDLWASEEIAQLVSDGYDGIFVPGIVTRQPEGQQGLAIGLSAPLRRDNIRLRAAATISPDDVVAVHTPYEVVEGYMGRKDNTLPVIAALEELIQAAERCDLTCGVFGSCALALTTGLPYCHSGSDVDLIVRLAPREQLLQFYNELVQLEKRNDVLADVEVELPGGWGVKLKELFDSGATVLAKGFSDVRLFSKDEVFVMSHRFPSGRKEKENGSQE